MIALVVLLVSTVVAIGVCGVALSVRDWLVLRG